MNQPKRHFDFVVAFSATFAALVGFPAGVLSLSGGHFSAGLTSAIVVFALVAAFLANRHRLSRVHLPVDHLAGSHLDRRAPKRLYCPCRDDMIDQVGQIAKRFYGSSTVGVQVYTQLRLKNDHILVCLTDDGGALLGYFDVIPLTDTFGEMFLAGRMGERDLSHADVLSPSDMHKCGHLYLSGIAVTDPTTYAGMENAAILMWGLLRYLDYFYSRAQPIAFASAVTPDGERLLQRFGLPLTSAGDQRRDRHSVYSTVLSHQEIACRAASIPDYSQLCMMDWDSEHWHATARRQRLPRRGRMAASKLRLVVPAHAISRTGS